MRIALADCRNTVNTSTTYWPFLTYFLSVPVCLKQNQGKVVYTEAELQNLCYLSRFDVGLQSNKQKKRDFTDVH